MNVTLKIDNTLCREARHRAVEAGLSLSGWIPRLLARETRNPSLERGPLLEKKPKDLLEALGDDHLADIDWENRSSRKRRGQLKSDGPLPARHECGLGTEEGSVYQKWL